ncbi:MAG: DEAD/DEAH box helicase [Candidatus Bathyarchaeia archaeon]
MRIEDLEIPKEAKEVLSAAGYSELYPPQEEAIRKGVLQGRNLVLASPTASGKTLIAELCALKHILEKDGKVLYLTPLRALASEKFDDFRKYTRLRKANGDPIRIAISTGDYDSSDSYLAKYDLIIATNEKVESLIRHRAYWVGDVSLVVADEVHLLQDSDRGPTLEVALARLKHINPSLHILALSATVRNAEEVAEWLGGDCVKTDWRPIPLREGVLIHDQIFYKDGGSVKITRFHPNQALNLAVKTVKEGGQALIFAETRKAAMTLAQKGSSAIKELLSPSQKRSLAAISEEILEVSERTRLSELIAELVRGGVAVHHAGIHHRHRKILEDYFRRGVIKLLVATPTLAAGVNLPARAVIINSYLRYEPGYGRVEIPTFEYKQMAGRAGRPKYDEFGEAILIAKTFDEQESLMEAYICAEPEKIQSKLAIGRVLRSHTLATIASGFANTEAGLLDFFSETFYAHQYGAKIVKRPVLEALDYLIDNGLVKPRGKFIEATSFGRRTSELYIDPESAVTIRDGLLNRASRLTDVSLLNIVCHTPDVAPRLYPSRRELQDLQVFLGEHEDELVFKAPDPWHNYVEYETFLGELKCVNVIMHWIEEAKENDILELYKVEPGDLYRLVETVSWLLYATHELASLFKCEDLLPRIGELKIRVQYGVKAELIPLVALEGVGRVRARALYSRGLRSLGELRRASVSELMAVPGIGSRIAKVIKEQVGGLIKREELGMLKAEKSEQRALSEFE